MEILHRPEDSQASAGWEFPRSWPTKRTSLPEVITVRNFISNAFSIRRDRPARRRWSAAEFQSLMPSRQVHLLDPRRRLAEIAVAQPARSHADVGDVGPAFALAAVGPGGEIRGLA